MSIREVDAGSCIKLEINALNNAYYDIDRCGIRLLRLHVDVLYVTGPVTKNMREAPQKIYEQTYQSEVVVAVGEVLRAVYTAVFSARSYACVGGVAEECCS